MTIQSELLARLQSARDGLQPLTGYGEDAIWRPANRAWEAIGDALTEIETRSHDDRELLAIWMIENSYATGHGDTFADLLAELTWQHAERAAIREQDETA